MFVTIINDSADDNARNRQATRAAALFGASAVSTVGVADDLQAAGELVDSLDASLGRPGAILVNVAPRHGNAKKWPNGTPFGYFYHNQTLVVSSVDGRTLGLVRRLLGLEEIELLDIPTVLSAAVCQELISPELHTAIADSQFRSFEFLPRVAAWLLEGREIPSEPFSLTELSAVEPGLVWLIDNFGNAKTTWLAEDIGHAPGKTQSFVSGLQAVGCYAGLKDVPDGQAGLIVGSSGLPGKRFLELVVQGKSAARRFKLCYGQSLVQPAVLV